MKNWALAFLISAMPAWAAVTSVTAMSRVTFTSSEEYSCRILRRRLEDLAKGRAGLHALLKMIKQEGAWTSGDLRRVNTLAAKVDNFPVEYYQRTIRGEVEWKIPVAWVPALNEKAPLAAHYVFKGQNWTDDHGVLPDEALGLWKPEAGTLLLTVMMSPTEYCFGPEALNLTIWKMGASDPALLLQTRFVGVKGQ